MSKYTTEVRFICENFVGLKESKGYKNIPEILSKSWDKIFFEPVEIFDPQYKSVLCQKILRHYYTSEIGFETAGLWIFEMNTKLQEIMPYYNMLYKSAMIDFNPLVDTDITKKNDNKSITVGHKESINSDIEHNTQQNSIITEKSEENISNVIENYSDNYTSTNNVEKGEKNLYSDTPQGGITDLEQQKYLTNARIIYNGEKNELIGKNTNQGESDGLVNIHSGGYTVNDSVEDRVKTNELTSEENINTTDDYLEHIAGKSGGKSYSQMIVEYRETLINIDMMVINEFEELFMGLW